MPAVKIISRVQALVLCAGLFLQTAHGEGLKAGVAGTNASPIATQLEPESVPGFQSVTRVVTSAGTNKFAFFAPRNFRIDASNPRKISLTSPDDMTFITVQMLPAFAKQTGTQKKKSLRENCRELLRAEHPGGKILSEFTRTAGDCSGPAFDLQWQVPAGGLQAARVAFIPTVAGLLEFKLSTKPDRFHAATYKFNNVLLSFRVSKNGKLEVVRLSNKL
ncbi:MAG TPA: hypothetical protein VG938_06820 [Verrucomicrobiae bacterium]|jgi:hypothetical protein|nr:hypothetical protein [Verrucomicrobiae bacterium]